MKTHPSGDDELDRLLRQMPDPLADDGFKDRVVRALPASSPVRSVRVPALVSMSVLGAVLGLFVFPGGRQLVGLAAMLLEEPNLQAGPVRTLLLLGITAWIAAIAYVTETGARCRRRS